MVMAERNEQDAKLTFHNKLGNIIGDNNEGAINLMEADKAHLAPLAPDQMPSKPQEPC